MKVAPDDIQRIVRAVLKRMYVKFVLLIDHEDHALSQLTVVRFHKDLEMDPITSFPPPKR